MNPTPRNVARHVAHLSRRAFTLIELLVVIAITAVLLTIILVPVFQGFNFTRAAQGYADAQDKARGLSERIKREIGNAAAVRDPSGVGGTVLVRVPMPTVGEAENGARIDPVPGGGTTIALPLQYAKIDLIPPAEGNPGDRKGNAFRDPVTGKFDPTLAAPKGQITLPLAPGTRLVRWFIGLRDPFRAYNNPYDGLLMARGGGRDNLYVLYRAEVEPVVSVQNGTQIAVNGQFFDVDPNGNGRTPRYDDPAFFLPNLNAQGGIVATDAKADRIRNWLRRAVVQTEISRYDFVSAEYNQSTRLVKLAPNPDVAGGYLPRLLPLLQFRPDRVANDPAEGQTAVRLGEEVDNGITLGPETFKTKFGAWSGGVVRLYPSDWNRTLAASSLYEVATQYTDNTNASRYGIFAHDATAATDDTVADSASLLFDSTQYTRAATQGRFFPYSEAVASANAVSGWLASTDTRVRPLFNPFVVDAERGQVRTSFGIDEVGPVAANGLSNGDVDGDGDADAVDRLLQLPSAPANSYGAPNDLTSYTPANDPVAGSSPTRAMRSPTRSTARSTRGSTRSGSTGRTTATACRPRSGSGASRTASIDLRVTPVATASGSPTDSPLSPAQRFSRARIVPGSEEVFGPDMNPGPNYGVEIRYRRTTREVPGPNEYRINYVDLQAPGTTDAAGNFVEDYSQPLGLPAGSAIPPAAYTPTNFVSAVVQPRYKAGYLVLCSEPNVPIPAETFVRDPSVAAPTYVRRPTRIRVGYRFQMTSSNDVVAVDYDTRSLISVLLTIRNYAQTNLPNPPSVSLKATATARNILR